MGQAPKVIRLVFLLFLAIPLSSYAQETATEIQPLRIGLTGKYPPFNYFDSKGNLTGFDVEIANHLCEKLKRPCEFKILQWDGIVSALLSHKIDAIIASMAITPERQKKVLFTDPYYQSGAQLFVFKPENFDPEKIDLKKIKIGYTLGTTYGNFAKKMFSEVQLKTYRGDIEIFQDLSTGRIQGILTDRLVGLYLANVYHTPIAPYGEILYKELIGVALPPDQNILRDQINIGITHLKSSGEYQKIFEKYFNSPTLTGNTETGPSWSVIRKIMFHGFKNTILLSVQGITLGIILAFILAAFSQSAFKLISIPFQFWIDFVRSTPFLVQILTLYFGLPAIGFAIAAWPAAVIAIAIHSSAYLAEGIKGAYMAIPKNQHHAAQCLGLSRIQSFQHVILPQMIPLLLPVSLNTIIAMIKDSAIVSVISVHELTLSAQELIGTTFNPVKFYLIAAVLYFLITYPLLRLGKRIEAQSKVKGLLNG